MNSGMKYGYRSGLEERIANQFKELGIDGEYEKHKISFIQPEKKRTYTPDYWIKGPKCTIVIESKGRFVTADRLKHLMLKEQHPELDIRFVFTNSRSKISKTSKTTYAMWCDKHGFIYTDKLIPIEWFKETGAIV